MRPRGGTTGTCLLAVLAIATAAQDVIPRPEPVLRIQAEGTFEPDGNRTVRVGDTVTYRLRISWNEIPAAVRLSPRATLEAPGFIVAGSSVVHARSSRAGALTGAGEPAGRTDYIYRLVPREAGVARVAPFVVRYHNGLTGREEELNVPAASVRVSPASKPFFQRPSTLGGLAVLALIALGSVLAVLVGKRRGRARALSPSPVSSPSSAGAATPEAAALAALRARCDAADSRVWMADAERLCISWLCRRLRVGNPDHVRFEAALDRYLDRQPALSLAARSGWTTLRELFHETRYGGVRREPHELHETCGLLRTCLLIDPQDADNQTSKGVTPP